MTNPTDIAAELEQLERAKRHAGEHANAYIKRMGEVTDFNLHTILAALRAAGEVERMREALERASKLIPLLTVRQVISAGDDAIEAAGLNPWAMNEGLATGDENISADFARRALAGSAT